MQFVLGSVHSGKVSRAAVLGAGTMGPGIAGVLAAAGVEVSMWARRRQAVENAAADARGRLELLQTAGLTASSAGGIEPFDELGPALEDAEVVIEAVSEDVEIKRGLLRAAETQVDPATVLASTTSGLDPDELSRHLTHPDRFVVTHFWNPAHLIPLVEVLGSSTAPASLVGAICDWLESVGLRPVRLAKFVPGFLGVRLQQAVVREAIALLQSGVASADDIDAATRLSFGARFPITGPLETSDLGGLDVVASIHSYLLADLDASTAPQEALSSLVNEGKLGVKTGEGFYNWSQRDANQLIARRDQELLTRQKQRRSREGPV